MMYIKVKTTIDRTISKAAQFQWFLGDFSPPDQVISGSESGALFTGATCIFRGQSGA